MRAFWMKYSELGGKSKFEQCVEFVVYNVSNHWNNNHSKKDAKS